MCAKALAYRVVYTVVVGAVATFAQIVAAKRGGGEAVSAVLAHTDKLVYIILFAEIYFFYYYSTSFAGRAAGVKIVDMNGHHPWTHPALFWRAPFLAVGLSILSVFLTTLCCSELYASVCDPESRPLSFQLTGLRYAAIDAQFPKAKAKPQQRSGNLPFSIIIVVLWGTMMLETALNEYEYAQQFNGKGWWQRLLGSE